MSTTPLPSGAGTEPFPPASVYDQLLVADWRRRVFDLYAAVRRDSDAVAAWEIWREARDLLFGTHPATPLTEAARETFDGLEYFPYRPELRVSAQLEEVPVGESSIATSDGAVASFDRIGRVRLELAGEECSLSLFWLRTYGGGIFLPFVDATSGLTTYGAGRYLLDTVKGADLGLEDGRVVLDFNFAYHPSCSYAGRWSCPLAPRENRLAVPIEAGERLGRAHGTAAGAGHGSG